MELCRSHVTAFQTEGAQIRSYSVFTITQMWMHTLWTDLPVLINRIHIDPVATKEFCIHATHLALIIKTVFFYVQFGGTFENNNQLYLRAEKELEAHIQ